MIEWSLFRLGPKNDWCLHLWGCIWQWKHLDFTLPGCLVCRNAGWVVQAYGSVSVLRLSCFVSLLRFHAPGIPYGLFLPLSALAHWGGGSRVLGVCPHWHVFIVFDAQYLSFLCLIHIVCVHSSVPGYYGGLQILALVNSAATNVAL